MAIKPNVSSNFVRASVEEMKAHNRVIRAQVVEIVAQSKAAILASRDLMAKADKLLSEVGCALHESDDL